MEFEWLLFILFIIILEKVDVYVSILFFGDFLWNGLRVFYSCFWKYELEFFNVILFDFLWKVLLNFFFYFKVIIYF